MTAPTTTLDERYSAPDTTATSWEQARAALQDAQLAWITTVRPDGRPHLTPLVAVWLDDALHFSTGAEEQKARNLRHNPQVALTVGHLQWDAGLDVVVEGTAARVTDRETLTRLAAAWATKWDGQWQFQPGDGGFEHPQGGAALVYAVRPARVLVFGQGTFTHTVHSFS